jgi:hypothetical protein
VVRAFLEADDGREFVMSKLVRYIPNPSHTQSVVSRLKPWLSDADLCEAFPSSPGASRRTPLLAMRKVGGYVDSWATPPDPGWTIVGAMRYRSRRDMMKLLIGLGPQRRPSVQDRRRRR